MTKKILAASGIDELDLKLESVLPDHGMELVGTCYHRSVLEKVIKETGADTVLMSPNLAGLISEKDFIDLVYAFRVAGLRAVILPGNPHLESTKKLVMELVPLGVYDFICDEVKVGEVVDRLINPGNLGDLPAGIVKSAIENEKVSSELEKSLPMEKFKIKEGGLKGKLKGFSMRISANKQRHLSNGKAVDINPGNKEFSSKFDVTHLPEGFFIFGKTQGVKSYNAIKELCAASPQAVLIFSSGPDLLETIKTLRRESALASVPLVVIGDCDASTCFAAGVNECISELDDTSVKRIQARAIQMKAMWENSARDALTGLYDRKFLNNYLEGQERHWRETGTPFSITLIDLDHFKKINDTHGHQAGDVVLKEFSSFLISNLRRADLVARYGGEEFIVVFPCTALKEACTIAEKVRRSWERHKIEIPSCQMIKCTFSAGVAEIVDHNAGFETLIAAADQALYRAKKSGRNQVAEAKKETLGERQITSIPTRRGKKSFTLPFMGLTKKAIGKSPAFVVGVGNKDSPDTSIFSLSLYGLHSEVNCVNIGLSDFAGDKMPLKLVDSIKKGSHIYLLFSEDIDINEVTRVYSQANRMARWNFSKLESMLVTAGGDPRPLPGQ